MVLKRQVRSPATSAQIGPRDSLEGSGTIGQPADIAYRQINPPPHFHAQYREHIAQIELGSLEVLNGSLPRRALRLVREWAQLHPDELAPNWALAQELEPLVPIDPLP